MNQGGATNRGKLEISHSLLFPIQRLQPWAGIPLARTWSMFLRSRAWASETKRSPHLHHTQETTITTTNEFKKPSAIFPFHSQLIKQLRGERDLERSGLKQRNEKNHIIIFYTLHSKFLSPSLTQAKRNTRVRLDMRLKISIGLQWTLYSLKVFENLLKLMSKGTHLSTSEVIRENKSNGFMFAYLTEIRLQ